MFEEVHDDMKRYGRMLGLTETVDTPQLWRYDEISVLSFLMCLLVKWNQYDALPYLVTSVIGSIYGETSKTKYLLFIFVDMAVGLRSPAQQPLLDAIFQSGATS